MELGEYLAEENDDRRQTPDRLRFSPLPDLKRDHESARFIIRRFIRVRSEFKTVRSPTVSQK